eukprot:SAG25_NODE_11070_length_314_cov_0.953488_1_plen_32_part_10
MVAVCTTKMLVAGWLTVLLHRPDHHGVRVCEA